MVRRSQSGRGEAWGDRPSGSPEPWRVFALAGGAAEPPAASKRSQPQPRSGGGQPWRCRPAVEQGRSENGKIAWVPLTQKVIFFYLASFLDLRYLAIEVLVVPQHEQMCKGQVEAQVKACRVVDLGVPAAQQEGEDGQTEEEEADDHAHPIQPLQKGVGRRRLRRQGHFYQCDVETCLLSNQFHRLECQVGIFQGVILQWAMRVWKDRAKLVVIEFKLHKGVCWNVLV